MRVLLFLRSAHAHRATLSFEPAPFLWDTAPMLASLQPFPGTVTEDGRGRIEALPEELLRVVFRMAVRSPVEAVRLQKVSTQFNRLASENEIWKPLFLERWPNQTKNLKLANWHRYFIQRVVASAEVASTCGDAHPIENCTFEFKCPLIAEKLKGQLKDSPTVFCDQCQRSVYRVETQEELNQQVSLGRCVAFFVPSYFDDEPLGGICVVDDEW